MSKVDLSKRGKLYKPSDIIEWAKAEGYIPSYKVIEEHYLIVERGSTKNRVIPISDTTIVPDGKDTRYFTSDGGYTSTDGSQGFIFERSMEIVATEGENTSEYAKPVDNVHFLRMPASKNYKLFLRYTTKAH